VKRVHLLTGTGRGEIVGFSMSIKSGGLGILVGLALAGGGAFAAQEISSIIGPDGTISACYSLRNGALRVVDQGTACAKGESTIEWNQQGPTGPQGVTGPPGPPGPAGTVSSLNGVPCDTGSPDKPDGHVTASVASDGTMSLKCLSTSTNPVLSVLLVPGQQLCSSFIITVCWNALFSVVQVDANGTAVPNGFTCTAVQVLSSFAQQCQSQRFPSGTVVRLGTTNELADGLTPSWTGCDSVSAGICTFTITAARSVSVTPV